MVFWPGPLLLSHTNIQERAGGTPPSWFLLGYFVRLWKKSSLLPQEKVLKKRWYFGLVLYYSPTQTSKKEREGPPPFVSFRLLRSALEKVLLSASRKSLENTIVFLPGPLLLSHPSLSERAGRSPPFLS